MTSSKSKLRCILPSPILFSSKSLKKKSVYSTFLRNFVPNKVCKKRKNKQMKKETDWKQKGFPLETEKLKHKK